MSLAHKLAEALDLPERVTKFTISVNFEERDYPRVRVEYEVVAINQISDELVRMLHNCELVEKEEHNCK